jgi:ankyrin repeat protein
LEQINDDESESDLPGMHRPFLSYAAKYWTAHYKEDTSDDSTSDRALDLCNPNSRHFYTWFRTFIEIANPFSPIIVENRNNNSWTHLMIAIQFGFARMVRKILQSGDAIEKASHAGMTPLMVATDRSNIEIMRILLEAGANANAIDERRNTALFYADCEGSSPDVFKLLFEFGADVNHKGEFGTILQTVATGIIGNMEFMRFLLTHEAIDVNAENGINGTALQMALGQGDINTVKLLVENGADVNLNGRDDDGYECGFPISLAAKSGSEEEMQILFDYGARIGANAEAALSAAMESRNLETLQWLLENGADPREKRFDEHDSNFDIFELAAKAGNWEVVKFLIKYRTDLYPDSSQHALRAAMKCGNTDFLRTVLTFSRSREDLESVLEIEFKSDDRWFFEAEERRSMILKKLKSASVNP